MRWLPSAILKKFFPVQKLSDLQYVDIMPRHESATFNFGESASFSLWINIINLSPFEVELDRAEFEISYSGVNLKTQTIKRQIITPGKISTIQISNSITDGQASQMVKNYKLNNGEIDANLGGFIEFNCKIHPFCKNIGHLSGIKPRVVNESFRTI